MNTSRGWLVSRIRTRPQLFVAAAAAAATSLLLPAGLAPHLVTRLLVGWNVGTCLYVILAVVMMVGSTHHHILRRAQLQDDGERVILLMAAITGIASLAAIGGELVVVKEMHGLVKAAHVSLAGVTVLSSWAFIQVMFALHYAHEYYAAVGRGEPGGLAFPQDDQPDYADFFHFAAVIGTSGQTADVAFVSKSMRRIGTVHCILAYLFNTTVLALVINIGASLF